MAEDASRWSWGRLHHARFDHFLGRRWPLGLLLNRALPFGGDGNTINNGAYAAERPFQVRWGSSYRLLVDMADLGHARAMNTTGQSGRPFSRHHGDMMEDWGAVRYHTPRTDPAEVAANAAAALELVPQTR